MTNTKIATLISILLLILSLIYLGGDFIVDQKQINDAYTLSNQANTIIKQLSDPIEDKELEKSMELYKQSLALHKDDNTRWNYEKTKEFLEKRSPKSEQSHNNGQPKTSNLQQSTENQQPTHTGSQHPQSSSGQQTTDNGQASDSGVTKDQYGEQRTGNTQLSESEKNKLQDYQQQLQDYQQQIAQDSNKPQSSPSDNFFGGSLFEQFFGEKNPFEEDKNSYEKDW